MWGKNLKYYLLWRVAGRLSSLATATIFVFAVYSAAITSFLTSFFFEVATGQIHHLREMQSLPEGTSQVASVLLQQGVLNLSSINSDDWITLTGVTMPYCHLSHSNNGPLWLDKRETFTTSLRERERERERKYKERERAKA